jgi:hypothetical protein
VTSAGPRRVIGVQYVDWNHDRYRNRPFTVVGAQHARWLFRGTGLHDGSQFGVYGIEIDARTAQSPLGHAGARDDRERVRARRVCRDDVYTTPRGAQVFAAGVINFGSSASWPVTRACSTTSGTDCRAVNTCDPPPETKRKSNRRVLHGLKPGPPIA